MKDWVENTVCVGPDGLVVFISDDLEGESLGIIDQLVAEQRLASGDWGDVGVVEVQDPATLDEQFRGLNAMRRAARAAGFVL